jgi:hypothetical protein
MSRREILTFTGRRVDPLNLRPSDVCIEDIAHSLSLLNRFTGHTRTAYSVAEHSIRVAAKCSRDVRLHGLLHDAAECYINDLSRPLKHRDELCEYRRIEYCVESMIYNALGVRVLDPDQVKRWDDALCGAELRDLMRCNADDLATWNMDGPDVQRYPTIRPLRYAESVEAAFLKLFTVYGGSAA